MGDLTGDRPFRLASQVESISALLLCHCRSFLYNLDALIKLDVPIRKALIQYRSLPYLLSTRMIALKSEGFEGLIYFMGGKEC